MGFLGTLPHRDSASNYLHASLLRCATDLLPMGFRALFARLALAVLLLFAQQQALQHELQHGLDTVSGKTNPASPLHEVCLKCVAFAGLDDAPAAAPIAFVAADLAHPLVAAPQIAGHVVREQRAYDSRAPPPLNS
jgi:hypothetical protein